MINNSVDLSSFAFFNEKRILFKNKLAFAFKKRSMGSIIKVINKEEL